MKKLYIVANWKSHRLLADIRPFLEGLQLPLNDQNKTIVVCPSLTHVVQVLDVVKEKRLPVEVGVQNISPFPEGAYTGEVNAEQVKEIATYVIIGHSERREHFKETEEMLAEKVKRAQEKGLQVIFCVQGKDTPVPEGVQIVAYEPVFAIGSGTPDTPENANAVAAAIKQDKHVEYILYGGSVKGENVHQFTQQSDIDGVLVGGASLDASSFSQIVTNA